MFAALNIFALPSDIKLDKSSRKRILFDETYHKMGANAAMFMIHSHTLTSFEKWKKLTGKTSWNRFKLAIVKLWWSRFTTAYHLQDPYKLTLFYWPSRMII